MCTRMDACVRAPVRVCVCVHVCKKSNKETIKREICAWKQSIQQKRKKLCVCMCVCVCVCVYACVCVSVSGSYLWKQV